MSTPMVTREAELSWQLHRAALPYLRGDWPRNQQIMLANLALLKRRPRAKLAQGWVLEWEQAVLSGPDAVERVSMTPGERGDDLRQVTPFAGVLPDSVRLHVLQQVRGTAVQ